MVPRKVIEPSTGGLTLTAHEHETQATGVGHRLPRAVAIIGGIGFVALGLWGMLGPRSFFDAVATFEPYNRHFLQDIGAFQIGLGAVLLLAAVPRRTDELALALLGVGVGALFHTVSHIVGQDLGGTPSTDIPVFGAIAILLLGAGALRWRQTVSATERDHSLSWTGRSAPTRTPSPSGGSDGEVPAP